MPLPLDHALFAIVAIAGPLADWLWLYPRLIRRGDPGARPAAYAWLMGFAWAATFCVVALWVWQRRPWAALLLAGFHPLRLGIGMGLAVAYVALAFAQWRAIRRRPEVLERVGRRFGKADPLVPRTPGERRAFVAVSLTAGFCEELLYRGYITWYISSWTGLYPALALASLLFGFAHLYLGVAHVWKTALVGAFFAVVAAASGSLWPVMVMHATMDLTSGDLGARALSEPMKNL